MTDNLSASYMCNQVLRVVKESNLNYLLNETPYSAFVTIRKKFVKNKESEVTNAVDDLALSDIVLRQENISFRQRLNGLESDKGQMKIEIDELELKLEELTVKNNRLEDEVVQLESEKNSARIRLEVTKGQLDNATDNLKKKSEEGNALAVQLKETVTKFKKLENISKERDDDLLIMECTMKNRDSKIEELKNELREIHISRNPKFTCEECTLSFETESDLKSHVETAHAHLCVHCSYIFVGRKKLKSHLCRIKVENPTSFWFYTKD